ncbi:hypothetical protein LOC68_05450 [Blastopirellula sp. JC732]|uniref:SLA1 homology domain-containing protein n=1 Tax=Blastopirellula sediminis TaxID=2894196 RepID=A0A9X1MIL4_9BACT|nr:SHD1 domain-containing protein [Blastopirellula sediminis]MCC9609390.1 hypothetical protein [Blastopirellula sediminis]MCC9627833.1 hypothetical protein [Blastopirellula sediminis]
MFVCRFGVRDVVRLSVLVATGMLSVLACDSFVKAQGQADAALLSKLRETQDGWRRSLEENRRLKQIAGFDESTPLTEIEAERKRLVTRFADPQGVPEDQVNLRMLLGFVAAKAEDLSKRNAAMQADAEQSVALSKASAERRSQMAAATGAKEEKLRNDIAALNQKYAEDRTEWNKRAESLAQKLAETQRQYADLAEKHAKEIAALQAALQRSAEAKGGALNGPVKRTLPIRKWTDMTGQFSVQAEIVGVENNVVTLQRTDGKRIQIPIANLSAADREYISSLKELPGAAIQSSKE